MISRSFGFRIKSGFFSFLPKSKILRVARTGHFSNPQSQFFWLASLANPQYICTLHPIHQSMSLCARKIKFYQRGKEIKNKETPNQSIYTLHNQLLIQKIIKFIYFIYKNTKFLGSLRSPPIHQSTFGSPRTPNPQSTKTSIFHGRKEKKADDFPPNYFVCNDVVQECISHRAIPFSNRKPCFI